MSPVGAVLRPSARWRLALVHTALFAVAGLVLLAITYALVSARLPVAVAIDPGAADPSLGPLEPLPIGDGGDVLEPGASMTERIDAVRSEALGELVRQSGTALAVTLVAATLGGWFVSGRVLRPLQEVTATARRLSRSGLGERIPVSGPRDELRELGETFNEMLDRLEAAFEQERRVVATMAHEIRTPLANQRVAAEVALADPDAEAAELRRALELVLGENERSQRVSERIMHLAQAEAPEEVAREEVDLSALVAAVAIPAGLRLRVRVPDAPVVIHGDGVLVARALDNLVDNAVAYNRPDGAVEIELLKDDAVTIVVTNDGAPVRPDEVDRLREPLRRGRTVRGGRGLGLGLAIVDAVARAHGGALLLTARPEGGLRATLCLPAGRDLAGPGATRRGGD